LIDDRRLRAALWFSVIFNLAGAFLFAFPQSLAGRLAGLPEAVPVLYRALLGYFVLLFAGTYLWLALQRVIVRPMIAQAAIGKASAFAIVALCWLEGAAGGRAVIATTGDLVLAAIFAAWLLRTPHAQPA
jgi:hypothetical protein